MISTEVLIRAFELGFQVQEVETANGLKTVHFSDLFTIVVTEEGYKFGSTINLNPAVVEFLPMTITNDEVLITVLEFIHGTTCNKLRPNDRSIRPVREETRGGNNVPPTRTS